MVDPLLLDLSHKLSVGDRVCMELLYELLKMTTCKGKEFKEM